MNHQLSHGFTVRAPTTDDAQRITDLVRQCDIADYGEADFSPEDLRVDWQRGGFRLERDAWLVFAPDGTLAAYGIVWDLGAHVRLDPSTCVHPKFRDGGLEDFLIAKAEEWTRLYGAVKQVQWIVNVNHARWTNRFEQRGYHTTRHDWIMEIEMSAPPPVPVLADGFAMRAFERGRDERAVWMCIQDAFRDLRGHIEDYPFEAWSGSLIGHADWSPELSTVVTQGDEVVAAAMAFDYENGGWIRQLGVRRPWRKNGLGLAMLHRVFGECYQRGVKKVGLGVDAESLTGATRLYERAGMHVKEHYVRYENKIA